MTRIARSVMEGQRGIRSEKYYLFQMNAITDYYAALLPRRGPHIASHSVRPSVCPSVRPSRYRSLPSVTSRHIANYNDTHVRAAYRTVISAAQILVYFNI